MILRYDGTLAGLLTLCRRSWAGAPPPAAIERPPWPAVGLFDPVEEVVTDPAAAAGLRRQLTAALSPHSVAQLRLAFLSEQPGIELNLWRYLARGRELGPQLDNCLTDPDVHAVQRQAARTAREGHRLKGLVRFRETADGTFYAPFRADANVLPLLAPHFARRLDRPWVLHDVRRALGAIGDGGEFLLGTLEAAEELAWSDEEAGYQQLWRAFHRQIAIPDRVNPMRQRSFMPLKYWEYLVEEVG